MGDANRLYWGLRELSLLMEEEVALDRIKQRLEALTEIALECRCGDVYQYIVDKQVHRVLEDGTEMTALETADLKCQWNVNLYHGAGGKIVRVEARRK